MVKLTTKAVIEARNISIETNGKRLLHDVSFTARPREITAIAGPNGAGKSTLLKALAGDTKLAAGSIRLHDKALDDYSARDLARVRAVLPQQTLLTFNFTVAEVVEMGRYPHLGTPDGDQVTNQQAIDQALRQTETLNLAQRTFPTLSGGEQARVNLARVLAQQTPLLLLDEPTAALDIRHQHLVLDIARELARQGAAVVAVLHDLNLAAVYADQLVLLDRSSVSACGSPAEVLTAERLHSVFACPVTVIDHPVYNCPLVIPHGNRSAGEGTLA